MKKTYTKKTSTLFYIYKLHDNNNKYLRDCRIFANDYSHSKKVLKQSFPFAHNPILLNTNDEAVLNSQKYA